jgi:hypothetical protein
MQNLIIQFNGYDTALNVVKYSDNKQAIKLSKEFLKFQKESEKLSGDDDNPFNADVHTYIEIEEIFLKEITELLTK